MTTPTVPEWTVSDRLRKARETAGISVEDMADQLGVSRNTVTNYERRPGKRGVPYAVIRLWSDLTGVELDWLTGGRFRTASKQHADPGTDVPGSGHATAQRHDRGTGPAARSRCFSPTLFDLAA